MRAHLFRLIRWGIVLLAAYVAWKVVPVYAAALRFDSYLSEAARHGAAAGLPAREIQENALWEAHQLNLPISPEDIQIQVRAEQQLLSEERLVMARVAYQVPLDVGPRRVVLNFHASASAQATVSSGEVRDLKKFVE
jgi:hypothetical protein